MSANPLRSAQVHRFRDAVALWVRGPEAPSPTVYLTPDEARAIATALAACADDCDRHTFAASQFRGRDVVPGASPPPDERRMYRIVTHYTDANTPPKRGRRLLTLKEAQTHCRLPATRGPGWFDGYELHPKFKGLA